MKKFYVIEADTEMYSMFAREVSQNFTAEGIEYKCAADAPIVVMENKPERFYGKLDAFLITRSKIENAQPITPEPQAETLEVTSEAK